MGLSSMLSFPRFDEQQLAAWLWPTPQLHFGRFVSSWLIGVFLNVVFSSTLAKTALAAESHGLATANSDVIIFDRDGARMTGSIAPSSDSDALKLQSVRPGIRISRNVPWERIARAEVAGHTLSADELRAIVLRLRSEMPEVGYTASNSVRTGIDRFHSKPSVPRSDSVGGKSPRGHQLKGEPIAWLAIDAMAAQWDSDVELDGLRLSITVYDRAGVARVVDGLLAVELWGEDSGDPHRVGQFVQIGSWRQRLRPTDFSHDQAVVRLPFQAVHPEFDRSIRPYGLVFARLSIPGHGTFESSVDAVRLRPFSPTRDRLQQTVGRRFFDTETTGSGRR